MSKLSIVLGLAALAFVAAAHGQTSQDTIILGASELTLGMSKDAVAAALGDDYVLQHVEKGDPSVWMVRTKSGPPYKAIGGVTFSNGRLVSVSKDWGPENQETGVEFAASLYGVINGLTQEGRRVCTIGVERQQQPAYDGKTIKFKCGQKQVSIAIGRWIEPGGREWKDFAFITEIFERR